LPRREGRRGGTLEKRRIQRNTSPQAGREETRQSQKDAPKARCRAIFRGLWLVTIQDKKPFLLLLIYSYFVTLLLTNNQ